MKTIAAAAWFSLLSTAALAAPQPVKMSVLDVGKFGGKRILLPCDLPEAYEGRCFLDTAGGSSIVRFMPEGGYKTGSRKISGIGWETSCDEVTTPRVQVGGQELTDFKSLLCPGFSSEFSPMVGMNLLWGKRFAFDFGKEQFIWMDGEISQPNLRIWKGGPGARWIVLNASFGQQNFLAAWDTGAPITLVNHDFVANQPDLFEAETEIELPPNTKRSGGKAYRVKAPFVVGGVELNGSFVHAVDLKKTFGEKVGDLPVILGTSHLRLADWEFDLVGMDGRVSLRNP